MKIALIGSTGFVGKFILKELLERGHDVTALVRNPSSVLLSNDRISLVVGDAYSPTSVANAVRGHDGVVSAFNPGWDDPDLYNNYMRGHKTIIEGVEKSEVKRIIVIGGAGSLYVAPGMQLLDTEEFRSQVPAHIVPGARAARDALVDLSTNDRLDWTFVSPPAFLREGDRTGSYRVGGDQLLMDGDMPAGISVSDFAVAIGNEVENAKHVRERFTVAS
ncbi:NAD(P)-bd_dom domain-containing protein [Paraburkholderia sabiae]|uniref:NAD(P)-dependent oxidoreductase n=1 Tax=Paraburkholderia sabiae TaxID=273251 RepID=UPI001CB32A3D|nr:NAD(P)H-binding protein [Paraburkholderia sabiae]CAG9228642.1 NAD(P)-bd_dom domain-containing protein [Paraburkholderia sabiae]